MQLLSATTRRQNLNALQQERFDVLVIGGGVTGAGVALEAAVRGYRVALVEKADFAGGTSSKSTKLVHGGIRYLPNFDFPLVHESLVERGLLLHNAPFLVQPLAFVLPLYRGDRHPVGIPFTTPGGIGLSAVLDIGLTLYDLMAGRYGIARHRRLSRQEVLRYAPDLVSASLKGGFLYYDAQTNDARLTMTLIRTAARYGAVIANYCEAVGLLLEKGRVCGARLRDTLDGTELTVQARHVVNAAGVFAERVEALCGLKPRVSIEPSKGVHLVFSREDLHVGEAAVVLPETEDRRILFIVPWQSRVIVGTTDTGSGDLDHPLPDTGDIAYLLKHLNRYLSLRLTPEQIISSYAGYRPLFKPSEQSGGDTARLSRTHAVLENEAGLVTIVGGKLTTYRRMAQDTVDRLDERDGRQPRHPTLRLRLAGSEDWSLARPELEQRAAAAGLASDITAHLLQSYGTETRAILQLIADDPTLAQRLVADLPYIRAEVIYACRHEMAMTPADVLARRTSLILEDRRRGLEALEAVAALMAPELGWSPEQMQRLKAAYRQEVERQLAAEEARLSA